jgi:transcriptional regulator with XRE-family HTH domain
MLSQKLRELREFNNMTQGEVARILNISREAYSKYENNKRQMNHESLCTLSDLFGVTADYLLGRGEQELFLLTNDEKIIIEKYRKIDNRGKQNISAVISVEYDRLDPKKGLEKGVS